MYKNPFASSMIHYILCHVKLEAISILYHLFIVWFNRFMALHLTQADFDTIHSNNKRISFESLENMINFYIKFIKKY